MRVRTMTIALAFCLIGLPTVVPDANALSHQGKRSQRGRKHRARDGGGAPNGASSLIDPPSDDADKPGWTLTFNAEFKGTRLDKGKFKTMFDDGPDHQEGHEYYAQDAFQVKDGRLRIRADRRRMKGREYTGGVITTSGLFSQQYGWFEIKAKVPKGKGLWSGFWMMPVNNQWPPEINVMEISGQETEHVYVTTHWRSESNPHDYHQRVHEGPDFSKAYHIYSLEWTPKELAWYIDGKEINRADIGVPDEPFYLLCNLAVGGDFPGDPDGDTPFPAYLDVKYIRAYKRR